MIDSVSRFQRNAVVNYTSAYEEKKVPENGALPKGDLVRYVRKRKIRLPMRHERSCDSTLKTQVNTKTCCQLNFSYS